MKVHQRMKNYLIAKGFKVSFIAQRSNIQTARFYRLMNGRAPLLVDEYETICRDGLKIDPGYFFNLNGLKNYPNEVDA